LEIKNVSHVEPHTLHITRTKAFVYQYIKTREYCFDETEYGGTRVITFGCFKFKSYWPITNLTLHGS